MLLIQRIGTFLDFEDCRNIELPLVSIFYVWKYLPCKQGRNVLQDFDNFDWTGIRSKLVMLTSTTQGSAKFMTTIVLTSACGLPLPSRPFAKRSSSTSAVSGSPHFFFDPTRPALCSHFILESKQIRKVTNPASLKIPP